MLGLPEIAGQAYANEILASITPDSRVLVYGDPDIDGLVSAKFYADYLDTKGIPYKVHVNSQRQHGFLLDPNRLNCDFILSGDFQVSVDTFKKVVDKGITWLCTDHHPSSNDFEGEFFEYRGSVMMNPLYGSQAPEMAFNSGAGVVLQVLGGYDSDFVTRERLAMVGWTLLSDIRPIDGSETASKLLDILYHIPYEGYFQKLIQGVFAFSKDWDFGEPTLDRNFVDFTLSPFVNSMLRFDAMGDAWEYVYQAKKPSYNYVKMQKELVAMSPDWLKEYHSGALTLKIYNIDLVPAQFKKTMSNFVGYLANKSDGSCLALLMEGTKVLRGSFRGKHDQDYRLQLEDMQCLGHGSAFGVKMSAFNLETLKEFAHHVTTLDEGYSDDTPVAVEEVVDLKEWVLNSGVKKAYSNDFTNYHKLYLSYKGTDVRLTRSNPKIRVYSVDGVEVISFVEGTPRDTLIQPVYSRNSVKFYLKGN